MNVLNQSCQAPKHKRSDRVIILCDREGFSNMKKFLYDNLSDSLCYLDDNLMSLDDVIIMTEDEDCLLSCDQYIFVNLVNVILCTQMTLPLNNIPSIFYEFFLNPKNEKIITAVHEICNIDFHILEGHLDKNSYEIMYDINWYELSENIMDKHLFIEAILTTSILGADRFRMRFTHPCDLSVEELDYSYIKPVDIEENTKEYKMWYNYITNATKIKYDMVNSGLSYETGKSMLPGCTACKVRVAARFDEWKKFFDDAMRDRIVANSIQDRELVKVMAEYMLDYAYTDEFRNKLMNLINTITTAEELPF